MYIENYFTRLFFVHFSLLPFIVSFFSCKNSNTEKNDNSIIKMQIDHKTAMMRIRLDSSIKVHFSEISKLLGIEDLKQGYDGEQVRIWLEYGYSDSGKVIVLKRQYREWESFTYSYLCIHDRNKNLISINKKINIKNNPLSGWSVFNKKMGSLGLYNLHNYTEIPNYFLGTGGDAIMIEIANVNEHKIYAYPNYKEFKDEVIEVENIIKVLLLIETEFGYYLGDIPRSP